MSAVVRRRASRRANGNVLTIAPNPHSHRSNLSIMRRLQHLLQIGRVYVWLFLPASSVWGVCFLACSKRLFSICCGETYVRLCLGKWDLRRVCETRLARSTLLGGTFVGIWPDCRLLQPRTFASFEGPLATPYYSWFSARSLGRTPSLIIASKLAGASTHTAWRRESSPTPLLTLESCIF